MDGGNEKLSTRPSSILKRRPREEKQTAVVQVNEIPTTSHALPVSILKRKVAQGRCIVSTFRNYWVITRKKSRHGDLFVAFWWIQTKRLNRIRLTHRLWRSRQMWSNPLRINGNREFWRRDVVWTSPRWWGIEAVVRMLLARLRILGKRIHQVLNVYCLF